MMWGFPASHGASRLICCLTLLSNWSTSSLSLALLPLLRMSAIRSQRSLSVWPLRFTLRLFGGAIRACGLKRYPG